MVNRRGFVKSGALALFAAGFGGVPSFIARAADSKKIIPPYKKNKVLVCIFQRGAMDGLMAVSPYADPNLKALRPTLYMSPSATEGGLTDLDGKFGLHPGLKNLYPFFTEGRMAIVHGVGSPNNTRSHFDAQDFMESGTPFNKGTASGWLNRAVGLTGHDGSPFRAVSLTSALPRSFYGDNEALAISNLQDFAIQMRGNPMATNMAAKSFEQLYDETSSQILNRTGKESFDAMKMLSAANIKNYQPANGAVYPNSALGNSLKQIATLIKMDVGMEIGFAESGGWDTHYNQGTANGILSRNLQDFGDSIAAFWKDMAAYQDDVTVMTMTEFGRTAHQNGTGGTDHGRASCLFVLGNDVQGGKVYNNIKSLAKADLEDGRDLPVTTDFRSVFSAVANGHLNINNNSKLFPQWDGSSLSMMKS
ncbi:DUF1501 domain-containing protein [Sediminibacterium ginsengisoli]|uniref:Uncharacterized conserved protein, DUF1501 family n=1 Tax=Sediminibacterium ginsengisoli TaxID=413434 RepID=A0A1T4NLH9_9BACT|nr:DUF1501 domain-containing protein [Sediminibacterium ginsengisoli]SJZ80151.1 Uncharacterized conserved protein, DUF1501 family [Sediminibacterium ginsengisoli]